MSKVIELKRGLEELEGKQQSVLTSIEGKVSEAKQEQIDELARFDKAIENQHVIIRAAERQEAIERANAEKEFEREVIAKAEKDDKGIESVATRAFVSYVRGVPMAELSPSELVMYKEAIKRGQVVGTDSKGGYLAPDYFSSELIKRLKSYGGMMSVAKIITTDNGNDISFSSLDDTANMAIEIAEATAASDQELAFGRVTLGAWKYTSGIFKISNELLQDSIVNVESEVLDAIETRFGRRLNQRFTAGDGTNKPTGLVSTAGGLTVGSNAIATGLDYDNLVDLVHSVDPAYRNSAGTKLMFNDATLAAVRKLKDADGSPIWTMGDITKGVPSTILGYNYVINQDMPSIGTGNKSIVFGDLTETYRIRLVSGVGVRRLTELYATSDEVGFVSFMRADGKVMTPNAAKVLQHA